MSVTTTLIPLALEANKAHQVALTEYAQSLTDELKELDSILNKAESIPTPTAKEDPVLSIQLSDTRKPSGLPIMSTNEYWKLTTPRVLKPKDIELLKEAISSENERLRALGGDQRQGINWTTISGKLSSRHWSPDECQYIATFSLSTPSWSDEDTSTLLHLASSSPRPSWSHIASSLPTPGHTPLACLRKHLSLSSIPAPKVQWDIQLDAAVRKFGSRGNWSAVALATHPEASATQCEGRWERLAFPTREWTGAEDERLELAVKGWGAQAWADVAAAMGGGRTNDQCRERWVERKKKAGRKQRFGGSVVVWEGEEGKVKAKRKRVVKQKEKEKVPSSLVEPVASSSGSSSEAVAVAVPKPRPKPKARMKEPVAPQPEQPSSQLVPVQPTVPPSSTQTSSAQPVATSSTQPVPPSSPPATRRFSQRVAKRKAEKGS